MTMYLCNAFSFNMISTTSAEIKMTELTSVEAFEWLVAPARAGAGSVTEPSMTASFKR